MTEFRGRVAFVTGAGSGIGRALACALAAEGAAVAVADILPDNAGAVAEEIAAAGGTAVGVPCDVCDPASIQEAKAQATTALGPVSLLFAVAGATTWERLTDMSDADVAWLYQVNLMGVVHGLRAFLPDMLAARDGHVLATASVAGLLPGWLPLHSVYSSAKLGVIGLMLNLRHELGAEGVGASVYCPSSVASGMRDNNARYRPDRFGGPREGRVHIPAEVVEIFKRANRVPRPAEEVAPIVLDGVRENRPIIFNSTQDRQTFQETYVDVVMAAFDEVARYEHSPA